MKNFITIYFAFIFTTSLFAETIDMAFGQEDPYKKYWQVYDCAHYPIDSPHCPLGRTWNDEKFCDTQDDGNDWNRVLRLKGWFDSFFNPFLKTTENFDFSMRYKRVSSFNPDKEDDLDIIINASPTSALNGYYYPDGYWLRVKKKTIRLEKVISGKHDLLSLRELAVYDHDKWHNLKIRLENNQIKIWIDGNAEVNIKDTSLLTGKFIVFRVERSQWHIDDIHLNTK